MNIYRILEDGIDCLIKAESMQDAVTICEKAHVEEAVTSVDGEPLDAVRAEYELNYYRENILQSCEFLGELQN